MLVCEELWNRYRKNTRRILVPRSINMYEVSGLYSLSNATVYIKLENIFIECSEKEVIIKR